MLSKCDICGKTATWLYMPGGRFYCDDCVPRGCSCNVDNLDMGEPEQTTNPIMWWPHNIKEEDLYHGGSLHRDSNSFYYEILDEDGRRSPCCEYDYSEEGFEEE